MRIEWDYSVGIIGNIGLFVRKCDFDCLEFINFFINTRLDKKVGGRRRSNFKK